MPEQGCVYSHRTSDIFLSILSINKEMYVKRYITTGITTFCTYTTAIVMDLHRIILYLICKIFIDLYYNFNATCNSI